MSSAERVIFGGAGLLVIGLAVVLWSLVLFHGPLGSKPSPSPSPTPGSDSASTRADLGGTPAQRLIRARELIEKEDFDGARSELFAISRSNREYAEARKLLARVRELDEAKRKSVAEAADKALSEARKQYAHDAEQRMLEQFHDIYVRTSGPGNTTITFRYVLMSRPLVYNLVNDAGFMDKLRSLGFKKAVFTDGYDETWTQVVD